MLALQILDIRQVLYYPKLLLDRWTEKVEDVVPLDAPRLLVFFRNGNVKHARFSTAPDRI